MLAKSRENLPDVTHVSVSIWAVDKDIIETQLTDVVDQTAQNLSCDFSLDLRATTLSPHWYSSPLKFTKYSV